MIHDQEEPESFIFESKPQLINLKGVRCDLRNITRLNLVLMSALSKHLNNFKVSKKSKGANKIEITITGWFYITERDPTEDEMIDFLEEQITDIIGTKIENQWIIK